MTTPTRETLLFKTPGGHEVFAEMDYEHYEVRRAKVVHAFTGVIRPLDEQTAETLSRALKAKQVYEHAVKESAAVEQTIHGFGESVMALGKTHPAVKPYWQEMAQHQTIASNMQERARHFQDDAMKKIDLIAGD